MARVADAGERRYQGDVPPGERLAGSRRRPDDVVLDYLHSLPETKLHAEIIEPLLREIATRVVYTHGSNERGKDFTYVTTDAYGDSTLEVCQVKNAPFHGRSGGENTVAVLEQLSRCWISEVLNPKTHRKERPQVVSLWTTYPIPDRHTADSQGLLDELRERRCKIIGPEKILELMKKHLPKIYQRLAYPGEGLRNGLRIYLQTHHEGVAFESQHLRVLSDFFVDMGMSQYTLDATISDTGRRGANRGMRIPVRVHRAITDLYESLPVSIPGGLMDVVERDTLTQDVSQSKQEMIGVETIRLAEYAECVQVEIDRLYQSGKPEDIARAVGLMANCGYLVSWVSRVAADLLGNRFSAEKIPELSMPGISPEVLLAFRDCVCVTGDAGAGKTCLARMLALAALDHNLDCVYFPCSRMATANEDLPSAIVRFLVEISDGAELNEARRYLESASIVVLDGADEAKAFSSTLGRQIRTLMLSEAIRIKVPGKGQVSLSLPIDLHASLRAVAPYVEFSTEEPLKADDFDRLRRMNPTPRMRTVLTTAEKLYAKYKKLVVVTTRSSKPLGLPRVFTGFALKPLSDSQLNEFFTRWFGRESEEVRDVLSFLDHNPNVREICRLPIVATIVASIKENGYDLPHSKTEVYSKRFDLLLERWDAARGVPRRTRVRAADKIMLLMRIALTLHLRHQRTFARDEFERVWYEGFERHYPTCPVDEVFYELLVFNSLICGHSDSEFSLGHLSFQEYLTAQALLHGGPRSLLISNFFDPWWRNVLVFYAGLLGDISSLIGSLQKRHGIGQDSKLLMLMMDEARFTKGVVRDFLLDAMSDSDQLFDEEEEVESFDEQEPLDDEQLLDEEESFDEEDEWTSQ